MLCVSANAFWLPCSAGSVLGKRSRTESDCSRGGRRVRKRSQEQHPRARYAFHAQTAWMHQDLGNPFNVHVKRTSSSEQQAQDGTLHLQISARAAANPLQRCIPSWILNGTSYAVLAALSYLARTVLRRVRWDGASQPAFISSQLAEETTSPRLCHSPRGCAAQRRTPSTRLCWEPRKS